MRRPVRRIPSRYAIALVVIGLAVAPVLPAAQSTLSGTITSAGQPTAGARVTAADRDSAIEVTVFSDRDGHYTLPLMAAGAFHVHASIATLASEAVSVTVAEATKTPLDLALVDDPNYRDRITSAQWLSLLPDGEMKREFILNCTSCHEIGGPRIQVDGAPRSREQWASAFAKMRAIDQYEILPKDFDDAAYIDWLTEHYSKPSAKTLTPRIPTAIDALAEVRITEYPLPEATELPHDLVIGPDGRVWITAFFTDVIWALEPDTGAIETFKIRPEGADGWGQARALVFDDKGIVWIILGGTHELVSLNPATRTFKTFNVGMYAHSLALDDTQRIWFNDYFAKRERIGVFDPATEQVRHIDIPSAGLSEEQGLPLPYGLQVDGQGRLYSTQMTANTVVMYDTRNGSAKLFTMPNDNVAPRRPAIGKDNTLWIPEWNTGYLSSFDPATETFKRYSIAQSALGGYDAEYDPRSGEIWVTGALDASMVVFDPATEAALTIPLPTNPGYTRHLAVDADSGDLWSAYSSLPAATPKVVRIERR